MSAPTHHCERSEKVRSFFIIAALVVAATSAQAQTAHRDRLGTRFDNDIRANNEAMSRRFSGPNDHVTTQNTRMRERLNSSRDTGLRRR
jgi:hypothetical protein